VAHLAVQPILATPVAEPLHPRRLDTVHRGHLAPKEDCTVPRHPVWALRDPRGTSASCVTSAWAVIDPGGKSRRSRTLGRALSGPGWTTSSPARIPTQPEEEDMDEAPATPPPIKRDDSSAEMLTDDEEDVLGPQHDSSSSDDGFQHV